MAIYNVANTEENDALDDNVASKQHLHNDLSCNCNSLIRFGLKSIMIPCDETTSDLGITSSCEYQILIPNSCNRFYHISVPLTPIYSSSILAKVLIFNDNN